MKYLLVTKNFNFLMLLILEFYNFKIQRKQIKFIA